MTNLRDQIEAKKQEIAALDKEANDVFARRNKLYDELHELEVKHRNEGMQAYDVTLVVKPAEGGTTYNLRVLATDEEQVRERLQSWHTLMFDQFAMDDMSWEEADQIEEDVNAFVQDNTGIEYDPDDVPVPVMEVTSIEVSK